MSNSFFNLYREEELERAKSMLQKDRDSGPLQRLRYKMLRHPGRELVVHSMWEGAEGMMEHVQLDFPMPQKVLEAFGRHNSGKINSDQEMCDVKAGQLEKHQGDIACTSQESDIVSAFIKNETDLSSVPHKVQFHNSKKIRSRQEDGNLLLPNSNLKAGKEIEKEKHGESERGVNVVLPATINSVSNSASFKSESLKKTSLSGESVCEMESLCVKHDTGNDMSDSNISLVSKNSFGKECVDSIRSESDSKSTDNEKGGKTESKQETKAVKWIRDEDDELTKEEWFWVRLTRIKAEIKSVRINMKKINMRVKKGRCKKETCTLINKYYMKIKEIRHQVEIEKAEQKSNNFSQYAGKYTPEMTSRFRLSIPCRPATRMSHIETILKEIENQFVRVVNNCEIHISENRATFPTLHQLSVRLRAEHLQTGSLPFLVAIDTLSESEKFSVDERVFSSFQAGEEESKLVDIASPMEDDAGPIGSHISHTFESKAKEGGSSSDLFWLEFKDLKDGVVATTMRLHKINNMIQLKKKGREENYKLSFKTGFEQLLQVKDRIILLFDQFSKLKMEMGKNKCTDIRGLVSLKEQRLCKIQNKEDASSMEIVETMMKNLLKKYTGMKARKIPLLQKFDFLTSTDQLDLGVTLTMDTPEIKRKVVRVCSHLYLKKGSYLDQSESKLEKSKSVAVTVAGLTFALNHGTENCVTAMGDSQNISHENFPTSSSASHDHVLCPNDDPEPDIARSSYTTAICNCSPDFSEKESKHWDRLQELYDTTQECNKRLRTLLKVFKKSKGDQFAKRVRRDSNQLKVRDLRTKLTEISRKFETEETESNTFGYCKKVAYRHLDDGTKSSSQEFIRRLSWLKECITWGKDKIQKCVTQIKRGCLLQGVEREIIL